MRYWLPETCLSNRENENYDLYKQWSDHGRLELTPGARIDYRYIRKAIKEDCKKYNMQGLAYDPWNATQLSNQLLDEDGIPMVEHRQGFISMNEPTKELDDMIEDQKFDHGKDPILRWMAGNAMVREDPHQNIKVVKPTGKRKVDGIVALVMAVSLSITGEKPRESIYKTRGLRSV